MRLQRDFLNIATDLQARRESIIRRARLRGRDLDVSLFEEAYDSILGTFDEGMIFSRQLLNADAEKLRQIFALLFDAIVHEHESVPFSLSDDTSSISLALKEVKITIAQAFSLVPESLDDLHFVDTSALEGFDDFEGDAFAHDAPRPTLVFALDDFKQSAENTEAFESEGPYSAILRLRAKDSDAAQILKNLSLRSRDLVRMTSAPDECIVGAQSNTSDALNALVRLMARVYAQTSNFCGALTEGKFTNESTRLEGLLSCARLLTFESHCALSTQCATHLKGHAALRTTDSDENVVTIDPASPFLQDRIERSALLLPPGFVGRDKALDEVLSALRATDESRVLYLYGPYGVGKRTLTRKALSLLDYAGDDAPVVWGACHADEQKPYAALVAMLRSVCALADDCEDVTGTLDAFVTKLDPHFSEEERIEVTSLKQVATTLLGNESISGQRVTKARVQRLFQLLFLGLYRRSNTRVFMVIGRADGLSRDTREVIAHLARVLKEKLALVMLGVKKPRLHKSLQQLSPTLIKIDVLDVNAAKTLVETMLDVRDKNMALLLSKTKRNPLALVHGVRYLVESGLHRDRAEDERSPSSKSGVEFPAKLDDLLRARMGFLDPLVKDVLLYSAVLGRGFSSALLYDVTRYFSLDDKDVRRAVSLLSQTGFLTSFKAKPGAPAFKNLTNEDVRIAFEHPRLREVALSLLDDTERQAAESAVAYALEQKDCAALSQKIAEHHERAEQQKRSLVYLARATKQSLRLGDAQNALALIDKALGVLQRGDERRHAFLLDKERAHALNDDGQAQRETLDELLEQTRDSKDDRLRGHVHLRMARSFVAENNAQRAEESCVKAMRHLRVADDSSGLAEGCRVLALARFGRRDINGAIDALKAAYSHTKADDKRAQAIIAHQLGTFFLEAADAHGALEHLLHAYSLRLNSGDAAGRAQALSAIADVYVRTGRLHTALALYEKAIKLRRTLGDSSGLARTLTNLVRVLLVLGDDEKAQQLSLESRECSKNAGLVHVEKSAAVLSARAAFGLGDFKAADALLDNVRRRTSDESDAFVAMEAALYSAQTKRARAKEASSKSARDRLLTTALERSQWATQTGERLGYATGQVLGLSLSGDILLERGDTEGALMLAQRASEMLDDRTHTSLPIEEVYLVHARVLEALGDQDEALNTLERAHASLQRRSRSLPDALRMRFWSAHKRPSLVAMRERLTHSQPTLS